MRAIRITDTGGPEVLEVAELDDPQPGEGQIVVRVEAAGINMIDTYQRQGVYALELPAVLGLEGAGVVQAVGAGVGDIAEGDRVAWTGVLGSYAEQVVVPAQQAVTMPDGVELETAAAVMLQGITAHFLASSTFALQQGHTAVIHAAAGGVGHLLTQIAKLRGARVLATASTEEKQRLAREAGADEVIAYTEVDWGAAVQELTDGKGVDVVYDSVGRDTFDTSLDSLRPRGTMVLFGQSSGAVAPVDPQTLNAKGSLYLTRPGIGAYIATREELLGRTRELFGWIADGRLQVRVDRSWPLADVAEAHRYLEGRQSKGKLLLTP